MEKMHSCCPCRRNQHAIKQHLYRKIMILINVNSVHGILRFIFVPDCVYLFGIFRCTNQH